jgi:hypothetical protein
VLDSTTRRAPRHGSRGRAIIEAIHEARVMVLVFSAEANRSPQVLREILRTDHAGVTASDEISSYLQ